MTTYTIWHNPRCSKSRQTLALLEAAGVEIEIRLYLQDPPTKEEVLTVQSALGCPLIDMMRMGENAFKENGLSKHAGTDDLLAAIAQHPILIERPIVMTDDRAVIGRPPEAVHTLL